MIIETAPIGGATKTGDPAMIVLYVIFGLAFAVTAFGDFAARDPFEG